MHKSIENLNLIQKLLKEKTKENKIPRIVAVSKTFPFSDIKPLLEHGHVDFGENKIQEALDKWSSVKRNFNNIKLHTTMFTNLNLAIVVTILILRREVKQ